MPRQPALHNSHIPASHTAPRPPRIRQIAFTLIELLVVLAIIAVLVSFLLPTLSRARRAATDLQCASQLRQIYTAFTNYLNDSRGVVFWRAPNPGLDGMDWYVYGGRETGNTNLDQAGLFNRITPRPLNKYVNNKLEVFRCPVETELSSWANNATSSHFDWVGNSYNFNAIGNPDIPDMQADGFAGRKFSQCKDPVRTILFLDAGMVYPGNWHGRARGNICFADGHVLTTTRPGDAPTPDYKWELR